LTGGSFSAELFRCARLVTGFVLLSKFCGNYVDFACRLI